MSAEYSDVPTSPNLADGRSSRNEAVAHKSKGGENYKGFVAGVFSGIAKLTVG